MSARPRLCIDGPWRSTAHSTRDDQPFRAITTGAMRMAVPDDFDSVVRRGAVLPTLTYRPRTVQVGGRVYRVWTCAEPRTWYPLDVLRDLHSTALHALIDSEPTIVAACRELPAGAA